MLAKTLKVSKRYARALFSLARESNIAETTYEDMKLLDEVFSVSKELRVIMSSPVIREGKKQRILRALFGESIHPLNMAYMQIIVRKQRAALLPGIAKAFLSVFKEAMGIVPVTVITASRIDEKLKSKVMKVAGNLTDQQIEFHELVDPAIIGGFILNLGDRQYDASIRKKLSLMRKQLYV